MNSNQDLNQELREYQNLAKKIRREILEMVYRTRSPHIGCSFSIVEILVALYFKVLDLDPQKLTDPHRDRFVLSKGHGCPAFYAVLAERGIIDKNTLAGFAKDGGTLEQHPTRTISRNIEITSGSLGHGLSIGAGMALAAKYDKAGYKIFVLLGDGELNEGSIWEAALFASHHKLDNLVAIIDRNRLQALGRSEDIMRLEPLAEKWTSFGWATKEIDGHNFKELIENFGGVPFQSGRPSCIIADTEKGRGVSFMENDFRWHDGCPNEEEYKKALAELK